MSTIRIDRKHALGLEAARARALRWAAQVEREYGVRCTLVEGREYDTLSFSRSGINGQLFVLANSFQLHAQLGLLMGAFKASIESGIEEKLDALLKPVQAA